MKNKFFLFAGIILIIVSIISLILYQRMETRMPGFHAYDMYSWLSLCLGVGMVSYFIGYNEKK